MKVDVWDQARNGQNHVLSRSIQKLCCFFVVVSLCCKGPFSVQDCNLSSFYAQYQLLDGLKQMKIPYVLLQHETVELAI